jgi:hypothetical protein
MASFLVTSGFDICQDGSQTNRPELSRFHRSKSTAAYIKPASSLDRVSLVLIADSWAV